MYEVHKLKTDGASAGIISRHHSLVLAQAVAMEYPVNLAGQRLLVIIHKQTGQRFEPADPVTLL